MRMLQSVAALLGWVGTATFMLGGCNMRLEGTCEQRSTCTPTTPPDCLASPYDDPGVLQDKCGKFVSASTGDDGNDGTSAKPLQSLSKAIELATAPFQARRIYACSGTFIETIRVPAGVELFGGLECDSREWEAPKGESKATSILKAKAGAVPLRLLSGISTRIEGFTITATAGSAPGSSAVAVIVEDVSASFARSSIVAGDGRDAENGAKMGVWTSSAPAGDVGNLTCDSQLTIAVGAENYDCWDGPTRGGNGGKGGLHLEKGSYTDSTAGTSGFPEVDGYGKGGSANVDGYDVGCNEKSQGKDGKPGDNGPDGVGGRAGDGFKLAGFLDPEVGFLGLRGGAGKNGRSGSGGGGGGGRNAPFECPVQGLIPQGPSGGAGGAGGCGGLGGSGGTPGGSSIALIVLGKKPVTLSQVTIQAGNGGQGGDGAAGQPGQLGGEGGSHEDGGIGCSGGKGGDGGSGGHGGGGSGGHSIGIAYAHQQPRVQSEVSITLGTPGSGGAGNDLNSVDNVTWGADGGAEKVVKLPVGSGEASP